MITSDDLKVIQKNLDINRLLIKSLYGYPISSVTPKVNQLLQFNGRFWVPVDLKVGGEKGDKGDKGDPGTNGVGVPAGGSAGQVLAKIDSSNYNTQWITPPATGVTSVNANGGTTGLTFTGGPITSTGTLTLSGILSPLNGGTGLSSIGSANQLIRVNSLGTGLQYFTPTYLTGNENITLSGHVTGSGSTAITTTLSNTGVTAGSYTNADITVDAQGRITSAANGTGGGGGGLTGTGAAEQVAVFTGTNTIAGSTLMSIAAFTGISTNVNLSTFWTQTAISNAGLTNQINFRRARNGTTAVTANNILGRLNFSQYNGTSYAVGSLIESYVQNTFAGATTNRNTVFRISALQGLNFESVEFRGGKVITGNSVLVTDTAFAGVESVAANLNAGFEINSTSKGFLNSRLTIAQRNAMLTPTAGLTIFCTDEIANDGSTGVVQTYNGTLWKNHW